MLKEAHDRGLRTYGMFCPILPGIADLPDQIDRLVSLAVDYGAEEIFAEAVNPRGRGLILTQQALESNGYRHQANAIKTIRNQRSWAQYVIQLIYNIQQSVRKFHDINKLRFLQYPSSLQAEDIKMIKRDDSGVIWLGKD